jgi:hypothetical protein
MFGRFMEGLRKRARLVQGRSGDPPSPSGRDRRSHRRGRTALFTILASLLLLPWMAGAPDVDELEKLVRQWLDLRKEASQVKNDWKEQEKILKDELLMLERQKDPLVKAVEIQKESLESLEAKHAEAQAGWESCRSSLDALTPCLLQAEEHLASWRKTLPDFLYRPMEEAFDKVPGTGPPQNPSELSQRMQNVFGLYGGLEQLNCSIHAEKLVIPDDRGNEREMDALFFGLAFGFAVSLDDSTAAFGRFTGQGITWEWDPSLAAPVRHAWACYQKDRTAAFVNLPLRVKESTK